jgi:Ca2+-binding RTX toxin-like protein
VLGGAGNDSIFGGATESVVFFGDAGSDTLVGGLGNDLIYGGGDSDVIFAGMGDDTLVGDEGTDYLAGYLGNDVFIGGAGADYFNLMLDIAVGEIDTIVDFQDGSDGIFLPAAVQGHVYGFDFAGGTMLAVFIGSGYYGVVIGGATAAQVLDQIYYL